MKAWILLILIGSILAVCNSCIGLENDICQTSLSEESIKSNFDINKVGDDFQIIFYSYDSWGYFKNKIEIVKTTDRFHSNSLFITKNIKQKTRDSISNRTILDKPQIDSLIKLIDNLNCEPYSLDPNGNCCDGDYHQILITENNITRAWMWNGGVMTRKASGGKFIDSIKIKALWVEGVIYKMAGFNQSEIYYVLDGECVGDSIDFFITYGNRNYITKSIEINHPNSSLDEKSISRMACKDTVSFIDNVNITLVTKDDEIRNINRLTKYIEE